MCRSAGNQRFSFVHFLTSLPLLAVQPLIYNDYVQLHAHVHAICFGAQLQHDAQAL